MAVAMFCLKNCTASHIMHREYTLNSYIISQHIMNTDSALVVTGNTRQT